MPIPFRDQDEVDELGLAAFLRVEVEPDRAGYRGALFQVNARGEPVEFTYNRVATPASYLWRPGDIRRAALKKLAISLLATCSRTPRLLLMLTEQVGSELFCEDVRVSVPVGRIATPLQTAAFSTLETPEDLSVPSPDAEPGSSTSSGCRRRPRLPPPSAACCASWRGVACCWSRSSAPASGCARSTATIRRQRGRGDRDTALVRGAT